MKGKNINHEKTFSNHFSKTIGSDWQVFPYNFVIFSLNTWQYKIPYMHVIALSLTSWSMSVALSLFSVDEYIGAT